VRRGRRRQVGRGGRPQFRSFVRDLANVDILDRQCRSPIGHRRALTVPNRKTGAGMTLIRIPLLIYILDLMGVAVFAISGALAGIHRGLDLFGVAVLAAVAAIGGGTTRDVLLDRHPVFWIKDPKYLYTILAAAALTIVAQRNLPSVQTALLVADAFGLGLVALSGAQIAEAAGLSWLVIILMGTASFG
jgi:hypothetical protein